MVFYTSMYAVCESMDLPFVPFMGCVCLWTGLMFVVIACSGLSGKGKADTKGKANTLKKNNDD